MKTRNIIAILAALPIMAGFTGCKSDDELSAVASKDMLIVEGGNIELRSGDELKNVTITANCGWQMNVIQDLNNPWSSLSVQPQRGSGNGTLVIMSDQNTSIFDRLDTIMLVSDGGLRQKIALRQKSGDPTINISSKTVNFSAQPAGAHLMTINSNANWSIQTPAGISWMHVDKTSGSTGATTVNVTADPIQTDATRTTSFTILYGTSSAEVQVTQTGMNSEDIFLHAGTEQMGFSAEGGEQMLWVESNAEWNAYIPSSVTWLHVEGMHDSQHSSWSSATGVGNGELRIYCEPNNSTLTRLTAIVLIAGTKNPQQVVVLVEQAGVGTPESTVTVGDLTSLYVADKSAEFRFSFTSDQEVIDYGLVYSRENREPTRWNAEVMTIGRGGFTKSVLGTLENLEPNTTYYVRAYVLGRTGQDNFYYSPNVVTIKTSDNSREPGESDNPDPSLAPRR
jgi:hypothetical protein